MAQWKGILSLVLAILYLPASSLCLMERAGLLSSDDCCAANSEESSGDKSTPYSACCSLASPTYKLEDTSAVKIVAPMLTLLLPADLVPQVQDPAAADIIPVSGSPPELPQKWRFLSRAAAPPRAPSFVS